MPDTLSPLGVDIAAAIQPVIDEWMEGDHGGVIYTKELTDLIVEAVTLTHPVALYNAGYRAGLKARSPTMPDTPLSREELAAIRTDIENRVGHPWGYAEQLLAHIDALTAAVEGLPKATYSHPMDDVVYRAAVLAILRGEQ